MPSYFSYFVLLLVDHYKPKKIIAVVIQEHVITFGMVER